MKETAIWNHERMPIIDGMPASITDGHDGFPPERGRAADSVRLSGQGLLQGFLRHAGSYRRQDRNW